MLRIEPLTVTDAIIRKLQELIRSRQFEAGARLPSEVQLAREMGVSRASVREAVRALTTLGLVQRSKRGTYVRPEAPSLLGGAGAPHLQQAFDARHLYEARRLLEPGIAYLAAQRGTPADHGILRRCVERMRATRDRHDAFIEADLEFHLAMAKASQNSVLVRLLETLLEALKRSHLEIVMVPGLVDRALRSHEQLLDRIVTRDASRARRILRHDLAAIEQMYLTYLGAESSA